MKQPVFPILRKHFPEDKYVLLEEVRDKAGYSASRSADYIVMGLWPSRGLSLQGIELKSSRTDWLSEFKKPAKAENIFQYCDYFWLLTEGFDVAKKEEIPETWGWMNINQKGKVEIIKQAPKCIPTTAIDRHFLAALLKRASSKANYIRTDEIEDRLKLAEQIGLQKGMEHRLRMEKELNALKDVVREFQKESGIRLDQYTGLRESKRMATALRFILNGGADEVEQQLKRLQPTAETILNKITTALKAFETELEEATTKEQQTS